MKSSALLLAAGALSGCAFYNGVYNARQAERKGDALSRAGMRAEADSLYGVAANEAEAVLARHAESKWAPEAAFIAGWSWAMAARCDRAEPRLAAVLERSAEPEPRLERATLALGVCRVRQGRDAEARTLLAPLTYLSDRVVARDAALWAALASVNLGEADSVRAYLRTADDGRAEWEVARALVARREFAPAESLLERRAAHRDYRADLPELLRTLWHAGRTDAVYRVVRRYDDARAAARTRARLHLLVGELAMTAWQDSTARAHLALARRLSRDTLLAREATARLTLAELAELPSLVDAATVIARGHARAAGDPIQRRLDDNLLLVSMLYQREDGAGASLFLAAEVARDSLRAPSLARAMFTDVAALPRSPLAGKALAAIELLPLAEDPDRRSRTDALVAGAAFGDVSTEPRADSVAGADPIERMLFDTWRTVVALHADSVRRLRPEPDAQFPRGDAEAPRRAPNGTRPTTIPES
jgi:hypothetical protein